MEVYTHSGFLIKQIHDRLEKRSNNELRAQDLTMMQISVLLALEAADGKQRSMKELERHFGVAQPTVAGIVSRLEQKAFVQAHGDAEDKRIKIVHITKAGEACCKEASSHMNEAEELLLRGFTAEERELFHHLLKKAANNLK
ncbi:MAG: MarR family transcriptional regulator [Oscillibacter sp.]|nr:MarR family transcriptional regulator [Oscillibacter sp.]